MLSNCWSRSAIFSLNSLTRLLCCSSLYVTCYSLNCSFVCFSSFWNTFCKEPVLSIFNLKLSSNFFGESGPLLRLSLSFFHPSNVNCGVSLLTNSSSPNMQLLVLNSFFESMNFGDFSSWLDFTKLESFYVRFESSLTSIICCSENELSDLTYYDFGVSANWSKNGSDSDYLSMILSGV